MVVGANSGQSRGSEGACRGRAGGLFGAKVDASREPWFGSDSVPGKKSWSHARCSVTLRQAIGPLLGAKVTRAVESQPSL